MTSRHWRICGGPSRCSKTSAARIGFVLVSHALILSQALALLSSFESDYGKPIEGRRSADRAVAVADELQTQSPSLPRVRENAGGLSPRSVDAPCFSPARALGPRLRPCCGPPN